MSRFRCSASTATRAAGTAGRKPLDRRLPRRSHLPAKLERRKTAGRHCPQSGQLTEHHLADEPTGNLDSRTAKRTSWSCLVYASARHHVVVVTHSPTIAGQADRIIEIVDGRPSQRDTATGGGRRGQPPCVSHARSHSRLPHLRSSRPRAPRHRPTRSRFFRPAQGRECQPPVTSRVRRRQPPDHFAHNGAPPARRRVAPEVTIAAKPVTSRLLAPARRIEHDRNRESRRPLPALDEFVPTLRPGTCR
jgi:hypothetical protein